MEDKMKKKNEKFNDGEGNIWTLNIVTFSLNCAYLIFTYLGFVTAEGNLIWLFIANAFAGVPISIIHLLRYKSKKLAITNLIMSGIMVLLFMAGVAYGILITLLKGY